MPLNVHLTEPDSHEHLPFHPGCPVCRAERLAGRLAGGPVLSRRAKASLLATVLALSAGAPLAGVATAQAPGDEGTESPQTGNGPGDRDPGDEIPLPNEIAAPAPVTGGDDDSAGGAVEGEPQEQLSAPAAPVPQPPAGPPAGSVGQPVPAPPAAAPTTPAPEARADEPSIDIDDDGDELVLDSDDILTSPVMANPIAPPTDEEDDATLHGNPGIDEPRVARESGTLFERMSNIARGSAQVRADEDAAAPGFRREPIDIPGFLNRQNNR